MADIDIEQPACFYLGREYDLASKTVLDRPIMYDARDLTTHGVVVGMTGSGKTGLCINLLEEAAIDGIPCIIIDPKGDLANLLLQFPDLKPDDFLKWLNPEDARQKKVTLEEHAQQLADHWRKGLEEWGQSPERIARLRDSSEWRVYTPGSEAGLPLSILSTFSAPKGAIAREALNQKIDATTTALLGLTGIASDPVQSREHILIAQLLLHSWTRGQDLDLPQLITQIQAPPLRKIGAFDVDTFYPEKDRLKLAVALNNILAAPSFSTWLSGEALDLSRLLGTPGQKPRQLIFYVAHLEDAQRMFFLTLLLEEVLSWTRKQPGTTNLRAILYFDEVFGYLPPHPANPPTKTPLMTLLKQARAFGVGVLLATQNPVDLDYKALSNAGTWFVGKLQTERDKARLVEGLEGVAAEQGSLHDRSYLETVISALGNRVFLLHNVHRNQPVLFKSRWALSFLRGPMTRDQVALLMDGLKQLPGATAEAGDTGVPPVAILLCSSCRAELVLGATVCPACGTAWSDAAPRQEDRRFKQGLLQSATPHAPGMSTSINHVPPVLPAGVAQFYLPALGSTTGAIVYQPRLLGFAEVVFADKRKGLEHRRSYRLLAEAVPTGQSVAWAAAEKLGDAVSTAPQAGAQWADAPESLNSGKKLTALKRTLVDFLHGNAKVVLLSNRALDLVSEPQEDVLVFQARCRAAARHELEKALAAEKQKFRPKFEALNAALPDETDGKEDAESNGGSVLGWLLSPFRTESEAPGVEDARLDKLEASYRARCAELVAKWRAVGEEYEELPLKPRKSDIQVTHFGLAWAPFRRDETGRTIAAYKEATVQPLLRSL
ncbi:MAG: DUF87 domain-containing protein [Gemmataceae bacterium]|nr:DUF87 domain-containing protein [Gemmataceae bacterium]